MAFWPGFFFWDVGVTVLDLSDKKKISQKFFSPKMTKISNIILPIQGKCQIDQLSTVSLTHSIRTLLDLTLLLKIKR
jgi:hypothetical protein